MGETKSRWEVHVARSWRPRVHGAGGFRGNGLEMWIYEWRAMTRGRREGREADSAA